MHQSNRINKSSSDSIIGNDNQLNETDKIITLEKPAHHFLRSAQVAILSGALVITLSTGVITKPYSNVEQKTIEKSKTNNNEPFSNDIHAEIFRESQDDESALGTGYTDFIDDNIVLDKQNSQHYLSEPNIIKAENNNEEKAIMNINKLKKSIVNVYKISIGALFTVALLSGMALISNTLMPNSLAKVLLGLSLPGACGLFLDYLTKDKKYAK